MYDNSKDIERLDGFLDISDYIPWLDYVTAVI